MLHSLAKPLIAIAIVAMTCMLCQTGYAQHTPLPEPAEQVHSQPIGTPCADGCTIGNCRHCGTHACPCDRDGYCEKCRRLGLIGRLRFCGLFGRRCNDNFCRNGGGGAGGGVGGRFLPNGCGGKGCPPFGHYQMVYPVNPDHFDTRDGQVHAAQGYGVPMAVPLAPVVRQQYNYSWGVPASRITHISNHAPHLLHTPAPYGPGGYPVGPGGPVYGAVPGGAYPPGYCPQCQQGQGH